MVGALTMENCVEIKECIACGGNHLRPLLDLGIQPLANSFLKTDSEPEDNFPLATNYCEDCFHVQLTHKVNPDLLFKNYLYVSGTAKTQLEYFNWFANYVCQNDRVDTILDIGCNDGSQLDSFKKMGVHTYGVDPAENLYTISSENHKVHCGYFDENYPITKFDAVICQNAFAHNYDQFAFLSNMKRVVADSGSIYITTSQADMIANGEFDTIYHEHLSFYNVRSMYELCSRVGLHITEVLKHPIHGNSFIFRLTKFQARTAYLNLILDEERKAGLYEHEVYDNYREECQYIIKSFADYVNSLHLEHTIVGYGAPAKGNTLLNAAKIKLDFIVDDNPLKQGLYTPGMHIPVVGSKELEKYADEDLVFVPLAWNFYHEIKEKINKLRPNRKDMFLRSHPIVYVETGNDE